MSIRDSVFADILAERERQELKWGEQNHSDGTGSQRWRDARNYVRNQTDDAATAGTLTFRDILHEEVFEAFAEEDPSKLRDELVQVAAVAVCWLECLDRKSGGAS